MKISMFFVAFLMSFGLCAQSIKPNNIVISNEISDNNNLYDFERKISNYINETILEMKSYIKYYEFKKDKYELKYIEGMIEAYQDCLEYIYWNLYPVSKKT